MKFSFPTFPIIVTLFGFLSGPSLTAQPVSVVVTANPLWTDTGLTLTAGATVTITASGSWTYWTTAGFFGPDGDPSFGYTGDRFVPGVATGALIACVGPEPSLGGGGAYWAIGSTNQFTTTVAGELWLGINDDAVTGKTSDNAGSVTAQINIHNPISTELVRPEDNTVVSPDRRLFTLSSAYGDKSVHVAFEIEIDGPAINQSFIVGDDYKTYKTDTTYSIDPLSKNHVRLSEGAYTWRARAVLEDGTVGQWSDSRAFTVFGGIDVSTSASVAAFQKMRANGWSYVIVDGFGGRSPVLQARANLLNAAAAGFSHFGIYCFLNFDDKARKSADGQPVPRVQSGSWQVQQALWAAGLAGPNPISVQPSFIAIDVEKQYAGQMSPAARVARIAEAVSAVNGVGFQAVIYARDDNGEWTALTGNSTAFSGLPLWVPRYQRLQPDDLLLDSTMPWQPFGGWSQRSGKQYSENGILAGVKVDLNVFDPTVFGVAFGASTN